MVCVLDRVYNTYVSTQRKHASNVSNKNGVMTHNFLFAENDVDCILANAILGKQRTQSNNLSPW